MIVSLAPVRWTGSIPTRAASGGDAVAPARPLSDLPTQKQLQQLCAPVSREAFFAHANQLFAEERPVRELSFEFAHHPDPAVRAGFRIASQELGRSKMSEMERQERVNGGYEALSFLLASDPERVADHRVTEILERLPRTELTARYCRKMAERVPCKAHLLGPLAAPPVPALENDPTGLADFPYGKLGEAIERIKDPKNRPELEAHKEAWLGLADRWQELGIDDRLGYTGVYGLDLYAAMAESFPHWKPEQRIGPLLVQNQVNDGHGLEWLKKLPLDSLDGMHEGRARFQLMQNAIEHGHKLSARQKDELMGWFQPLHQGMIHLPWDWNGCRRESLSCLQAALPQLPADVPVRLREHLLAGPDTDLTLTFEDKPETLLAVLEHPDLEPALLREVPGHIATWEEMPQRARNAAALLALMQSDKLGEPVEPLVRKFQGRQDRFVAPYRQQAVARHLAAGELQPLLEMARDRRLVESLRGHEPPRDPEKRRQAVSFLEQNLAAGTAELTLATALAPTFPELGESLEGAVLRDPEAMTPELRQVFAARLAQSRHSSERRRLEVLQLVGSQCEPEWRHGATGWVAEVCRRLPEGPVSQSVGLLLKEDDPGLIARTLLDRIQADSLLAAENKDGEIFHARVRAFAELRQKGKSVEEALQSVQPEPKAGGILVREDTVIVGGTQLRVRR